MSNPALDKLYNNRAAVPEHPALFAQYAKDAAAFRAASVKAELGTLYGQSERQYYDYFPAQGGADEPLFIFIHGGYWVAHDPSFYSHMVAGVNGNGYDGVLVGYDLCPQVTLATIIDQVEAACAVLYSRFKRPLVIAGHSAGGHLAAMMALSPALDGMVEAIMPISGLFDLRPLVETYLNPLLNLSDMEAARLSPGLYRAPTLPTTVIVGGGETEAFITQSRDYAAHVPGAKLVEVARENHFTLCSPLADAKSTFTGEAVRLLRGSRAAM